VLIFRKSVNYGKTGRDLGPNYDGSPPKLLQMHHMVAVLIEKAECFQSVKGTYNKLAMGQPPGHLIT
jgi:hypothetical protein